MVSLEIFEHDAHDSEFPNNDIQDELLPRVWSAKVLWNSIGLKEDGDVAIEVK